MRLALLFSILFILSSCDLKTADDYFSEAEALEEQQKYKEAILLLDKAIEKDDKFLGAYMNRGVDKSALGEYNEAIKDYECILHIDPKNTSALFNIANNYKRLNNYRKAIDYYNKALDSKGGRNIFLDMEPNGLVDDSSEVYGHEIFFERGIAYYNMDSLQHSLEDFNFCIRENYHPGECHYWIAHIYLKSGQDQVACLNLQRAKEFGDKEAALEVEKYCK